MKILILRFSSIGDIVLTTPVIRNLKTQLDDSEIHYCTKSAYEYLLSSNPYIDKIHKLDGSLSELIKELKAENFDLIIDLHSNLRTRIIKTRLGVKSNTFHKLNFEKWLMVNLKIDRLPNIHIVDRYMNTLRSLDIKPDALGLEYFIPEKDEVPRDWLPETHRAGYVVFAIGGQHSTKKLPLKRMIELCDRINRPVILIGGPEDSAIAEEIETFFTQEIDQDKQEHMKRLNKKTIIFNACGKFNVNQSASLIRNSNYVFTHDTGMMHIAAAFKKQVFSIWGNTIPEFGMYPYKTKFTIFETRNLSCRPCSKIGYSKCPKGHFKCMNNTEFDFYLP